MERIPLKDRSVSVEEKALRCIVIVCICAILEHHGVRSGRARVVIVRLEHAERVFALFVLVVHQRHRAQILLQVAQRLHPLRVERILEGIIATSLDDVLVDG